MNTSKLKNEIIKGINDRGNYFVITDDNTWIQVCKDEEDNKTMKVIVRWEGWWDSDVCSLYTHDVDNYNKISYKFKKFREQAQEVEYIIRNLHNDGII